MGDGGDQSVAAKIFIYGFWKLSPSRLSKPLNSLQRQAGERFERHISAKSEKSFTMAISKLTDHSPAADRSKVRKLGFIAIIGSLFVAGPTAATSSATPPSSLLLSKYKGKVVYLDYWASWCGPCKVSFPYMQQLSQKYGEKGFVVVTVNVDKSRAKADNFLVKNKITLPVVYDPNGATAKALSVKDMPTSFLIGRDGRIRHVHKGFFAAKKAEYQSHITELLNEK